MGRKQKRAWSTLKGQIPDAPDEGDHAAKIGAAIAERENRSMTELVREYNALVAEEEAAKAEEKTRNVRYAALERLINKQLETMGTDIWRGEGVSVSPKYSIYPSVKDPVALREHMVATGQEDKLTVPWPRLRSDLEEMLKEAMERSKQTGDALQLDVPEGVEVFLKTSINHRKANN